MRGFAERSGLKLGAVAQPLRAALTGRTTSPPIFDVLAVLGKDESLARLRDQAGLNARPLIVRVRTRSDLIYVYTAAAKRVSLLHSYLAAHT